MTVLGYRMWWQRRPTRGDGLRPGRPPRRGAWRSLPVPTLVVLVVVAVGVGWFLPVWGVSLAVFLLVDGALGLRDRRRRAPQGRAPAPELDPVGEH